MTDREMLLIAYGAMKTIVDGSENKGLLIVVDAMETHIFKDQPITPPSEGEAP